MRTFDVDLYNLGEKWYDSGLLLDDAPTEYQMHPSFVNGYKRGERLELIKKLATNPSKKSKV